MHPMKISVSVSVDDVDFMDRYAREHGVASRSAVVQRAITVLQANELADDYAAAWREWEVGEADAWQVVDADGVVGQPRA